ncbi:MAG: sigma-70 family RNA polymerase sigma factor [Gemmataceae bacterium]
MSTAALHSLIARVRQLTDPSASHQSDRMLLEAYTQAGQQEAFAALVRRHGRLVFGICKRILRHDADAEDAFQATFLVLANKAGHVRWQESIANWLYSVALRVARQAQVRQARRRRHEQLAHECRPTTSSGETTPEALGLLDCEIQRLPQHYRAPLLLCHLEGLSPEEAAARLGWTVGSVRGRLHRARELLRDRLRQPALLPLPLEGSGLSPAPPTALVGSAVGLALRFASDPAGSAVPAAVAALTQGALFEMTLHKLFTSLLAVFVVGLACAGTVLALSRSGVPRPSAVVATLRNDDDDEKKPTREEAETRALRRRTTFATLRAASAKTITVDIDCDHPLTISFDLASKPGIVHAREPVAIESLPLGKPVALRLAEDHRTVTAIRSFGKKIEGTITAVDPKNTVVTVKDEDDDDDKNAAPKAIPLAKNGRVLLRSYPTTLPQLVPGLKVQVEYAADGKSAVEINADFPEHKEHLRTQIKSFDADASRLTVEHDDQEFTFDVEKNCRIQLDGKVVSLKEMPKGCFVIVHVTGKAVNAVDSIWAQTEKGTPVQLLD